MTTPNFDTILDGAKAQGVTVKQFCTFCVESAQGELLVDDKENIVKVPVCEKHGLELQNMYGVDTLDTV